MVKIVVNTKGGVGKSTVSSQFLAAYLFSKNQEIVDFVEIDDENKSVAKLSESEILNAKVVSLELLSKFIDNVTLSNQDLIIDVGGNYTATKFLEALKNSGGFMSETVYYIPMLHGDQDALNAHQTYTAIREFDKKSKVIFVLNNCQNYKNIEHIEYYYPFFFGREELEIEPLQRDTNTDFITLAASEFYLVASKLKQTIYEYANNSELEDEFKAAALEYHDTKDESLRPALKKKQFFVKYHKMALNIVNSEYVDNFKRLDAILDPKVVAIDKKKGEK